MKTTLTKLYRDVRSLDFKSTKVRAITAAFLAFPVAVGLLAYKFGTPALDIRSTSVKITNRSGTSGGTGVILSSSKNTSTIITNNHVCGVVAKNGGLVSTANSSFQVTSLKRSQRSDLCLVTVSADLGQKAEVSSTAPKFYDEAVVSGHPQLMPNVITKGHVSGRQIIDVMIGVRECTEADYADPSLAPICAFFGKLPEVKSYESVLVTATIMPGSSGSGVYNEKNELIGLVFAGSGQLGYAWTVPYEQVVTFLQNEVRALRTDYPSNLLELSQTQERGMMEIREKCMDAKDEIILNLCKLVDRNLVI